MRWNAHGGTILVVDDDLDVGEALAEVLLHLGARPVVVTSAASARRAIAGRRYDAILSDLSMPDESGYDLLRGLRAQPDPAVRELPAIAVSAHCSPRHRQEALAAGFDGFVAKPFGVDDIRAALSALPGQWVGAAPSRLPDARALPPR